MAQYRWQSIGTALLLGLALAVPARAGVEQQQLAAIHELAEMVLGLPAESSPATPCPCAAQTACPCGDLCAQPVPNPGNIQVCSCSHLSGGTVNHKLLGRTWYYGWAMRTPGVSSAIKSCARRWLVDWHLTAQQTWGHYSMTANTDEVLTTTHGQLYLAGLAAAYLFGLNGGQNVGGTGGPYPFQDGQVVTAARKWYLDEEHLWDLLDNNSPAIHAPGARFNNGAIGNASATQLPIRNEVMRQVNGLRPLNIPFDWQEGQYHTGSWILEELFNRLHNPTNLIAPLAGHTPGAKLHDTLCIYRSGSSWLYYFPKLRAAANPIFWVQSRPGEDPHSAYAALEDGGGVPPGVPVFPPVQPAPFPGATTQKIQGVAAGAETTCPSPTAF